MCAGGTAFAALIWISAAACAARFELRAKLHGADLHNCKDRSKISPPAPLVDAGLNPRQIKSVTVLSKGMVVFVLVP